MRRTHSSFCFPPVCIPHTAFYYPNPMAGALHCIYPSLHATAPICHLLCSSITSRPISLLRRGHLATRYLFQLSCLPQRLYVMTLILTRLGVLLVKEFSCFGRSTRWSGRCAYT